MKIKSYSSTAVTRIVVTFLLLAALARSQAQPVFAALPAPVLQRGLFAAFTDCASQSQIPATECDALVALYNAAGGASWTDHSGWLTTDTPCDDWSGVACSANHVTRLSLNDNNLSGALPSALGDLPALQRLSLTDNQLSGALPASLGNLTALQVLNLNRNQLSGAIPAALQGMTALQTLNLSNNSFSAAIPTELGSLPSLTQLLLANNELSGAIPVELGSLAALQALNLSGNQLEGTIPTQLGSLSNLTGLLLSSNNLEGAIPTSLGGLANLTTLRLDNNQLSGAIPVELGSLSNLKVLELYGNQLSGAIPPALGSLSNLEQLILGHNLLSGSPPLELGNLSNLWHLSLVDNPLSGPVPEEYDQLTSLTTFRFYSTSLCEPTSAQFQNWKDAFTTPKIWLGTASCYGKTSPANAASDQSPDLLLTWGAMNPAAFYEYCIDTTNDNACTAAWVGAGTNTSVTISGLSLNTTYYWQARAKDKLTNPRYIEPDNGAWWSFTTADQQYPPDAFSKSSPADNATGVSRNPTLTWGASSPGVTYEYCGSPTSASCPGDVWTSVDASAHVDLNGLAANQIYYWQVRARNSQNDLTYANSGTWWQFTTTSAAPPAAFGKSNPQDASIDAPINPTLSWTASDSGVTYEYCLTDEGAACPTEGDWVGVGGSLNIDLSGLAYSAAYHWQVRATNDDNQTTLADGGNWWSFTTVSAPPPAAFAKTAPANNAAGVAINPTLTWAVSAGATAYEYCVSTSGAACPGDHWTSAGASASAALSGLAYSSDYYWQARAVNSEGATTPANGGTWWQFTTTNAPPPAAFAKTAPANNAVDVAVNPTLTWTASDAGVTYEYCVSISGANCPGNNWFSAGDDLSAALTAMAYNTLFYWQVRAVNSEGTATPADGGTWWGFTTAAPPPLKLYLPIIFAIAP